MLAISQQSDFSKQVQFGMSEFGDLLILNETSGKLSPYEVYKNCDCYQGTHGNNTLYGSCCWLEPQPGGFPPCAHGCI